MKVAAHATVPGPHQASATVPAMHTAVDQASTCFFAACASAHAPRMGPATITSAYETASAAVHANVAQGALPATTETKYALNTAVSTTVVYPELAKSYIAHAATSRFATPGFRAGAATRRDLPCALIVRAALPYAPAPARARACGRAPRAGPPA